MKDLLKKSLLYFDNLNFNYKTAFLVFIIAGGMICIIILSQISIPKRLKISLEQKY